MFGWEFPPHIAGGLGTACYGMTRGLAQSGVDVTFVVPRAYGDEDQRYAHIVNASDVSVNGYSCEFDDSGSGDFRLVHIDSNIVPYVSPEDFARYREEHLSGGGGSPHCVGDGWSERYTFSGKYGANLMEEVARYAQVAAQVAKDMEGQFDVIHAHDWLTYYAGVAAKEVLGLPLVVHLHASEFDRSGESVNEQVFGIEKRGMELADRVIAVSNLTRNIAISKYGIDADKVVTVHNAVHFADGTPKRTEEDIQRHKGLLRDKIVTFLGRITFQKGPEYFVDAAAKVLARSPNVRFVMAGSGDMMPRIIKRVARLGISDRFHFTGFLEGDEVSQMFELSDLYIMPSVSEPFGISPLEAMRSNVPVIISKQSGVSEVLDYAVKVDYWDVDSMADAIYGFINYPALGRMFADKGMREVNKLKWSGAAKKINRVYTSLLIPPSQPIS